MNIFDGIWITAEHVLTAIAFICLGLLTLGIILDFIDIKKRGKNPWKEGH